jgi:hypothetical protein
MTIIGFCEGVVLGESGGRYLGWPEALLTGLGFGPAVRTLPPFSRFSRLASLFL